MIKTVLKRSLPALILAALPLLAGGAPAHATHTPPTASAAPHTVRRQAGASGARAVPLPLFEAIDQLAVADEQREGYVRTLYKHWNKGLNADDG
ncbi:hypothetical protein ABZ924_32605 [Streptomyces sp. NPDC046876]|uniref:hypothetical protein n=1 Tax=Streptomyces sp. NPDC046876 TaxID=3155616 RepID=UPI0033E1A97D